MDTFKLLLNILNSVLFNLLSYHFLLCFIIFAHYLATSSTVHLLHFSFFHLYVCPYNSMTCHCGIKKKSKVCKFITRILNSNTCYSLQQICTTVTMERLECVITKLFSLEQFSGQSLSVLSVCHYLSLYCIPALRQISVMFEG